MISSNFKCLHIADTHWRGLTRHNEYRESFSDLFVRAKELKPDIIYIGGDIVHSKTQGISPELIDCLNWWFTEMAKIAPVHVILGNHDGLILNKHRQDAISPILDALNNPRIYLYKKSGVYPTGIPGYNWCVFSCFDEDGWESAVPINGEINIALFHGAVVGCKTDFDWSIEGEIEASFFDKYDFAFLGDIHRRQFLNERKTIAYCGSTIQQNYGETPGKGFLFWTIRGKNDFDVKFHPVKHSMPFVTIDWTGSVTGTSLNARAYKDKSRFRIRVSTPISQAEIKHLHAELKEKLHASEIVFKYEDSESDHQSLNFRNHKIFKEDLRDSKTHLHLLRNFYDDKEIPEDQWDFIEKLVNTYVASVAMEEPTARNVKWSIKKLSFENTFAYGKDNVINFDKLSGVSGIFGKNRVGKSSIPGTLMYVLFNTTDRGPIKNLHIINSRKGHCMARVDVNVDGRLYSIERQTVKHQTRKGKMHAVTHLNLLLVDSLGNTIKDLTGEQRRETEKTIKRIVGTADDFLLTSLASQGEMNNFIKQRATSRKSVLGKFLDLNIFDKLYEKAKEDSNEIRFALKNVPDREWDTIIFEKKSRHKKLQDRRGDINPLLEKLQLRVQNLQIILATHKENELVTAEDIDGQKLIIEQEEKRLLQVHEGINVARDDNNVVKSKLKKIQEIKEQFPIDELHEKLLEQQQLEKSLVEIEHNYERERTLLKNQKKSVKKLANVPCGDEFPTCKYIKESHQNKLKLTSQEGKVEEIMAHLTAARKALQRTMQENLKDKIAKYDAILIDERELHLEHSKNKLTVDKLQNEKNVLNSLVEEMTQKLAEMRLQVRDNIPEEVLKVHTDVKDLRVQITQLDTQRLSLSEQIGLLTSEIEKLQSEKAKYAEVLKEWRAYELFMNAVSKKGIPLWIMSAQLPAINAEISKILQGVVGFTVELEADSNSNDMDIFINYGDSRRIIECASGMEKMVSSLAIRVALINISSLPKTDLLIIDEGFGALDELNVEACNRLLESLKKWFKNILVISHVDAVKDAVDNNIEIMRRNKDAHIQIE